MGFKEHELENIVEWQRLCMRELFNFIKGMDESKVRLMPASFQLGRLALLHRYKNILKDEKEGNGIAHEELNPCPYCGGSNITLESGVGWEGAYVTLMHRCELGGSDIKPMIKMNGKTRQEAVDRWNQRA